MTEPVFSGAFQQLRPHEEGISAKQVEKLWKGLFQAFLRYIEATEGPMAYLLFKGVFSSGSHQLPANLIHKAKVLHVLTKLKSA